MERSHKDEKDERSITRTDLLLEDVSSLYMSQEYSDVTLLVANERICAHKAVLAVRNPFFRALLFGGLEESMKNEVELKDVDKNNLPAFKELLKYIYSGIISLEKFTSEVLVDIVMFANLYNFVELMDPTTKRIECILSVDNILQTYSYASIYQLEDVINNCLLFMDENAADVLRRSELNSLTHNCLKKFISRDSILVDEFTVFQAVHAWIQTHPEDNRTELLSNIQLHLVPMEHMVTGVRPTGLFPDDIIMDAVKAKWQLGTIRDSKLECRQTALAPVQDRIIDVNVADIECDAKVVSGSITKVPHNPCSSTEFDENSSYTSHEITGHRDDGILIDLGRLRMINHIKMYLMDTTEERYWYYIEVSTDEERWLRVIDHRGYYCYGSQNLYFEPTIALYIRIVGTNCTANGEDGKVYFCVVNFRAYYTNNVKDLNNGFVVPDENVATLEAGTRVVSRDAIHNSEYLLKENSEAISVACGDYIEVQLTQPYVMNSLRFLLPEEYWQSYTVSISVDSVEFVEVAEQEICSRMHGWQNIQFKKPEIVSAVRINAVEARREYYRYNEQYQFRCFYFQCPSNCVTTPIADSTLMEDNVHFFPLRDEY